jgi:hypothetical protein
MNELSRLFTTNDLSCIVDFLIPGCREKTKMVNNLREDEELLLGMLKDDRLVNQLTGNRDSLVKVSPGFLFAVFLLRAKQDLEQQPYTVEQDTRTKLFVFDSGEVADFLNDRSVLIYLIEMLCSFVRINSYTTLLQVRRGVWERLRFSDFDIDSLIRYSELVDEGSRYFSYKRIADICLFTIGIFPTCLGTRHEDDPVDTGRLRTISRRSREELRRFGTYFYRQAARQRDAGLRHLDRVLLSLSERFTQAEKPLLHMSRFYLGFIKDQLFLR